MLEADESYRVIGTCERDHPRTAPQTLPRMLPGYDVSETMRRELAEAGTIVAIRPLGRD